MAHEWHMSYRPRRPELASVTHLRLQAGESGCPCGTAAGAAIEADFAVGRDIGGIAGSKAALTAGPGDSPRPADITSPGGDVSGHE
jgi:hypothetical protein